MSIFLVATKSFDLFYLFANIEKCYFWTQLLSIIFPVQAGLLSTNRILSYIHLLD